MIAVTVVFVQYAACATQSLMFHKLPCTNVSINSTTFKFVRMVDWCLQVESALLHVKSGDIFEFFRHAQRGRNHIKFLRN